MRTPIFIALALTLVFSSCTMMLLEEFEGGHSPMMILDGEWQVDDYYYIENGQREDVNRGNEVFLYATRDVGGYCEGEWHGQAVEDFLWGIDEEGDVFTLKDESEWEVDHLDKDLFKIKRSENGKTYYINLSR